MSKELHDDLEEEDVRGTDRYGMMPGIVGLLLGLALIAFMFAVADGFA